MLLYKECRKKYQIRAMFWLSMTSRCSQALKKTAPASSQRAQPSITQSRLISSIWMLKDQRFYPNYLMLRPRQHVPKSHKLPLNSSNLSLMRVRIPLPSHSAVKSYLSAMSMPSSTSLSILSQKGPPSWSKNKSNHLCSSTITSTSRKKA